LTHYGDSKGSGEGTRSNSYTNFLPNKNLPYDANLAKFRQNSETIRDEKHSSCNHFLKKIKENDSLSQSLLRQCNEIIKNKTTIFYCRKNNLSLFFFFLTVDFEV
jgi:hypothetical protein